MSEDIPGPATPTPILWALEGKPLINAPYVVKNIIGPGELVLIYGAPKSGKTFFATDLALRVAGNLPWFGHLVKPGLVIYVASEMGYRVQRRFYAWIKQHREDMSALLPCAIVPQVLNLLDEVAIERLFATLGILSEQVGKPSLVVIDTLARSMSGGDENTAQDIGRVIAVTDRLRDEFDAATALVHHAGKDPGKGARGSSSLLGAVDASIFVEADDNGTHRAKVEWSRASESGQQYSFKLPIIELGIDNDGDMVTTCVLQQSEHIPKAAKVIRVEVSSTSLAETIQAHGQNLNGGSSTIPKGVKACLLDQWKAQWLLRTGYDAGPSADSAFWLDKKKLLVAGTIQISKPYVWFTSSR